MSYPVTLTSNKAEFQNYLSDQIKIAKNSEVCLTKTAMSIPVKVNQFVTIPSVDAAKYGDQVFVCIIDGIKHFIDWNNIYDAYTVIDTADGIEPINQGNFYSGKFRLPLNNFIIFRDVNDTKVTRANIGAVIAAAFDAKYSFYDVESHPIMKNRNVDEYTTFDANTDRLTINGVVYSVDNYQNYEMDLGFLASYSPEDTAALVTTVGATWTPVAGNPTVSNDATGSQIVTTTGNGTGSYDTIANNLQPIDPNGGYLAFTPSTVPATTDLLVGLTYSLGQGLSNGITSIDAENVPIGVKLLCDGNGDLFIQIYDGLHFHDHGTNEETNNNRIPFDADIVSALETDTYFIYFDRVGINSQNAYTYSFAVYKNPTNSDFEDDDTEKIYQSQNSYPNIPDLIPTVMCNQTGVTIQNIKQVNIQADSLQQTDHNVTGFRAPQELASFNIQPGYELHEIDLTFSIEDFYEALGFVVGTEAATRINKVSAFGNPFQYSISYERVAKSNNTAINFGSSKLIDTLEIKTFNDGEEYIDYKNVLTNMPRFLDIKINDMAIRSMAGQLVGAVNTTTTSITRDICNIPIPSDSLNPTESFNLDISYEPYNLIYRQLFNTTEISINQFIMKISYKDFTTDNEVNIKDINGTLKIELHIKPV